VTTGDGVVGAAGVAAGDGDGVAAGDGNVGAGAVAAGDGDGVVGAAGVAAGDGDGVATGDGDGVAAGDGEAACGFGRSSAFRAAWSLAAPFMPSRSIMALTRDHWPTLANMKSTLQSPFPKEPPQSPAWTSTNFTGEDPSSPVRYL